ncbi:phosphatidate cytidylyltransferase [Nonomuraea longicatena]|uniref:Phosphatidate cytidylyltransferase n=1 Tax=Nonomuraea longicatena TaxID=83682 RepID=A0ABP4BLS7_9ACTN
MEDRAAGRSGRNLPAAIGVGVLLGAAVIGSLYTRKELFLLVMAVAVGIGVLELVKAFGTKDIAVPGIPVLVALVGMLAGAFWGGAAWLLGVFAAAMFGLLIWRMFAAGTEGYVRDATASVFTLVYPPLLAAFAALLLAEPDGPDRVVIFIAVTVASDVGGYVAGVLFGRHKMSIISPKKTWEGFAGSVVACVAVGAWLVVWRMDGEIWQGALIGALGAAFATLGDLIESMIKRDLGIKDLGSILPGHGGLMDRLDSLVATLVPTWVLLSIFF